MLTPFDLPSVLSPILTVLLIGATIGGFAYAFRNGRTNALTKLQADNNAALKERIEILESKIVDQAGEIADLKAQGIKREHVIETITDALRKSGLVIGVDGEMYPIAEKSSSPRKRTTITQSATVTKKEEV